VGTGLQIQGVTKGPEKKKDLEKKNKNVIVPNSKSLHK